MYDLHCHLLPGIDDGPAELSVSLEMARMAVADGITIVACTPHIYPGLYDNDAPGIRAAIARLGAKQDGVLRNHKRHSDGSPRDTVVFSIIDGEWPAVKRNLLAKLARHEQDSP